ncbi:SH3 domain-containing protein [Flavobacteriaceae bacterium]|nr:SH3 domain-containing protein [Flavobacteriaceae bacterium]
MKKSNRQFWIVLTLICIIGAYLSGPNSPFSTDNVEDLYSYKVINDVNLRDKPSSKSNIIDVLKQNEPIVIVDSLNNWYNITDTDSNNGYVSKKYITKTITNSNTSEIQPSINNKIILAIVCLGFVYFIFMRNKSKDDLKVKSVSSNKASIISKAKDPTKPPLLDNKPLKNMTVAKGGPIKITPGKPMFYDYPTASLRIYLDNLIDKGGNEETIRQVKDLIAKRLKPKSRLKPKLKKSEFDKLSVNQQKNCQIIIIIGIFESFLNLDLNPSSRKTNMFHRYKRELESKMIPDKGFSLLDTGNNLIDFLSKEKNKFDSLKNLSNKEEQDFFEHLISFVFIDGSSENVFTVEIANAIGDIIINLFPDKNNDQVKEFITSLVSKYSNSKLFSIKTNKKLLRFSNGAVHMELEYKDGSRDILNGPFKEYFEDGKIKTEGFYENNKWHGLIKDYNSDGLLIAEAMMRNGIENGEDISYHNNGNLKQKATKENGILNGLVEVYNEDGILSMDQVYKNGEATGKYRQYFIDGTISHEGQKQNNEFSGLLKAFFETGELKVTINYDTNFMRIFNPDGTLFQEKYLED